MHYTVPRAVSFITLLHTGFTLRSQQVSKKIGLYSTAVRKSSQNPLVTKMRLNIDKDLKSRDIVPSSSY